MLTREILEDFKARHVVLRDQFLAKAQQCQGAMNAAAALVQLLNDQEAKEKLEAEKKALASEDKRDWEDN